MTSKGNGASHEAPYIFFEYLGTELNLATRLGDWYLRVDDGYVVRRGSMNVVNFSREIIGYIFRGPSQTEHLAVNQLLAQDVVEQLMSDRLFREIEAVYDIFYFSTESDIDDNGKVMRSVERKLKDTLESWGYIIEMVGINLLYKEADYRSETLRRNLRQLVGYIIFDEDEPAVYADATGFLEFVHRLSHDSKFIRLLQERTGELEQGLDEQTLNVIHAREFEAFDDGNPEIPPVHHSVDPEVDSRDSIGEETVRHEYEEVDEEPTEDTEDESIEKTELDLPSLDEEVNNSPER